MVITVQDRIIERMGRPSAGKVEESIAMRWSRSSVGLRDFDGKVALTPQAADDAVKFYMLRTYR